MKQCCRVDKFHRSCKPNDCFFFGVRFWVILAPARVIIGRIRFPPAAIKCPANSGISGTSLDSLSIIIALTARISSASRATNGSSETVLDRALDCALFVGTDIALITFFQSLLFHRGESNKRFYSVIRCYSICATVVRWTGNAYFYRACHTPIRFSLLRWLRWGKKKTYYRLISCQRCLAFS